jgi:pimeloyl-ACP methyl ester carboxylesterase
MASILLRALGILLLLTALAMALSRAPDLPATALVARWGMPPSQFVDVKGQATHLRDQGPPDDAVPLVLLHGTSASLHTWEGWVQALAPRKRVITLDLPAFGLTGPNASGDYHGDAYARFVLDTMDTLGVRRFSIGGNSLGGEVAWRVAAMAPERVERLVLVDAVGPKFKPEKVPLGFLIASLPVFGRISEVALPREMVEDSVRSVYGDPSKVTDELVARYYELTLREGNRRALGQRLRQMVNGEHVERIDALALPTLILWGGRDRLIPPAIGLEFQRLIEGSRLVVFDTLGHVPQEEDPAATVQPVLDFLGLR